MSLGQCSYCGDIHHDSEDCSFRTACRMREALEKNHEWHLTQDDCEPYQESELWEVNTAALSTAAPCPHETEVERLETEARQARAAIRHALQFLKDKTHRGDGHLRECIDRCAAVLELEPRLRAAEKGGGE